MNLPRLAFDAITRWRDALIALETTCPDDDERAHAYHWSQSVSRMAARWATAYGFELPESAAPTANRDTALRKLGAAVDDAEALSMDGAPDGSHPRLWGGCRARVRYMRDWMETTPYRAVVAPPTGQS